MTCLKLVVSVSFVAGLLVLGQSFAQTQPGAKAPKGKQAKIQNAISAAPPGISKNATILDWPATQGGQMVELRKGTNGWICLPDMPATPANDPMCMDKNGTAWALATCFRAERLPITMTPSPRSPLRARIGSVSHPTS